MTLPYLKNTSSLWLFGFFLSTALVGVSCAKKDATHSLVESDLNGVELQERVWSLQENNDSQEAERIKGIMSQTLTSGHCNISQKDIGGKSQPKLLYCDHGIQAVFKKKNIPYPYEEVTADRERLSPMAGFGSYLLSDTNAELAAYAIDELLNLHIIPMIVPRTFSSLGSGSVQYFVKDTEGGAGNESTPGFRKMKILDFIINNEDRWLGNWLYLPGANRVAAIDHARSFFNVTNPTNSILSLTEVVTFLGHEPILASRIRNLTDQELYNSLKTYLATFHIRGVQHRIHQIQSELTIGN